MILDTNAVKLVGKFRFSCDWKIERRTNIRFST